MAVTPVSVGANVGSLRCVVVPSPSCPYEFAPHAHTDPSGLATTTCVPPPPTGPPPRVAAASSRPPTTDTDMTRSAIAPRQRRTRRPNDVFIAESWEEGACAGRDECERNGND